MNWVWIDFLFMIIIKCTRAHSEDYIGCFEHEPDYNKKLFGYIERTFMETNNGLSCKKLCHPYYPYSGTEGTYCYCGNMLKGKKVDDDKCNTPCPDQRHSNYTICGGTLRMSVYHVFSQRKTTVKHGDNEIQDKKSDFLRTTVTMDKIGITLPVSMDLTSPLPKETDVTYITAPKIHEEDPTPATIYVTTTSVPVEDPTPATIYVTTTSVPVEDPTPATIYVTTTSVPVEDPTISTIGSTTQDPDNPVMLKTAKTNQLISSVNTNIVVTICAIGTFAVVCLLATVKLCLFLKRRSSNTGRNNGEDELYIRPVYVPTSEDNSNDRNYIPEFHNNIYDYVEDISLTDATSQLHLKQYEISTK